MPRDQTRPGGDKVASSQKRRPYGDKSIDALTNAGRFTAIRGRSHMLKWAVLAGFLYGIRAWLENESKATGKGEE